MIGMADGVEPDFASTLGFASVSVPSAAAADEADFASALGFAGVSAPSAAAAAAADQPDFASTLRFGLSVPSSKFRSDLFGAFNAVLEGQTEQKNRIVV